MFGYIMPLKSELKVREYEIFKGYYCGLCKALGSKFNQLTRFGLNYDLTFLALVLSSIDKEKDRIKGETCIVSPFRKKPIVQLNKHIDYTADISVILTYFKLMDDWKDEKKAVSVISALPFKFPVKRVKKKYYEKYNRIKHQLDYLNQLESKNCSIVDEAADAFAKLMEEIAVPPYIDDMKQIRILKWFGYNIGRWIYIIDAYNDIQKDIEKDNYNPLLLQYKFKQSESVEDFKERVKDTIETALTFTLDNIAKSFELLDVRYNTGIIKNIIYMGTRHKMQHILGKGVVNNEKSL